MLLTVTTTHQPATDLGYLLHKHPERVQEFKQSFGTATVFYPEASDERCTVALMLDVDPVRLARSRGKNAPDFSLAQFVNDRSYAASSLLGVAMADVFGTARSGRCNSRQDLADSAIPLEIVIPVLPCRGGSEIAHRLFEPLGWTVEAEPIPLDDAFADWGDSRYVRLRLTGTVRLADALNQLYVLLPVLDESKHYWQGPDEVDKLLRAGEGLARRPPGRELDHSPLPRTHGRPDSRCPRPARRARRRDAKRPSSLPRTRKSCSPWRSVSRSTPSATRPSPSPAGPRCTVRDRPRLRPGPVPRADCCQDAVVHSGRGIGRVHPVAAVRRPAPPHRPDGERQAERVELFQGALTYEDERFDGYDAAVLMEVIEHVDPPRLEALERVVFGARQARRGHRDHTQREYNVLYEGLVGHAPP